MRINQILLQVAAILLPVLLHLIPWFQRFRVSTLKLAFEQPVFGNKVFIKFFPTKIFFFKGVLVKLVIVMYLATFFLKIKIKNKDIC